MIDADRLRTIIDEAFGLQPAIADDDLLSALERLLWERGRLVNEKLLELERLKAELADAWATARRAGEELAAAQREEWGLVEKWRKIYMHPGAERPFSNGVRGCCDDLERLASNRSAGNSPAIPNASNSSESPKGSIDDDDTLP